MGESAAVNALVALLGSSSRPTSSSRRSAGLCPAPLPPCDCDALPLLQLPEDERKKLNLKKCREKLQQRVADWFRGSAGRARPASAGDHGHWRSHGQTALCEGRLLGAGDVT